VFDIVAAVAVGELVVGLIVDRKSLNDNILAFKKPFSPKFFSQLFLSLAPFHVGECS